MLSQRIFITIATLIFMTGCRENHEIISSPQTIEIDVIVVHPEELIITKELPGRVMPVRVSDVRPQITGIILKKLFIEGHDVIQGQPLYQIDDSLYQSALQNAKGTLAQAQANLRTTRLKAERYQNLVKSNAVSQQECDDAVAAFKSSCADCVKYQANVDQAQINMSYTTICAPIAGRIGISQITEGGLAVLNQSNSLTTIMQLDPIYIDITQPSSDGLKLQQDIRSGVLQNLPKHELKIKLIKDDGSQYSEYGALEFSDIKVDPSTGSVIVRAIFSNPKCELLPGTFVRVILPQGKNNHAILVPHQCVIRDRLGNADVLIVTQDSKVEKRSVIADQSIGQSWLVTSGLKSGDQVVISGFQKIKPNMTVKINRIQKNENNQIRQTRQNTNSKVLHVISAHQSLT